MGILEEVINLKNQGRTDQEIMDIMQQEGVSPKQISDAIGQAQIKQAVSYPSQEFMEEPPENFNAQLPPYISQTQEIPRDYPQFAQSSQYQAPAQGYNENYNYPPPQDEGYSGYASTGASDSDMVIEIAEQVFLEKVQKIQKQLDALNEFKAISEIKLNSSEEKLKRIESALDRLQAAILNKIGTYGDNLESIKKEVSMIQDTFSKTAGKKIASATSTAKKSTRKKSSKK
jgi:hypothetical protein